MQWEQSIKVFTDHTHLTRDALGLIFDRIPLEVTLGRICPKIIYIKVIHNTVPDAAL